MNNMRRGFTMIELIFVIVIIGILAAVAIPKLAGTATKARESVHEGFVGTMNRSIGAAMWADNVSSATPGSIANVTLQVFNDSYGELPEGVANFTLAECGVPEITTPAVYEDLDNDPDTPDELVTPAVWSTGYEKIADITNLEQPASLYCLDGTGVASPKFGFDVDGSSTIVYEEAQ